VFSSRARRRSRARARSTGTAECLTLLDFPPSLNPNNDGSKIMPPTVVSTTRNFSIATDHLNGVELAFAQAAAGAIAQNVEGDFVITARVDADTGMIVRERGQSADQGGHQHGRHH
jgi:hypothetical protein